MSQLTVTELDFEGIKQSLKNFLKAQNEFSDYDFDGSGLSILIDTLAYNTHYNAILAHLLANENFIDSAIKRSSVVSIAKAIGYTPRSAKGATATINLRITPPVTYSLTTFTLDKYTVFTSTLNNSTYKFYPRETVVVAKETRDGISGFYFDNLAITEGTRVADTYTIDSNNQLSEFIIKNPNVDISTLKVQIQKSSSIVVNSTFDKYSNFSEVSGNTRAYFLEETSNQVYSIKFGDDIVGKKLDVGNILTIEYITTNQTDANFAKNFALASAILPNSVVSITTVSPASGGQPKESIDSIRRNAPRLYQTQNRTITAFDYQAEIMNNNPNIKSCVVWGGEENDPPIHGKVFISLTPLPNQIITPYDKNKIRTEIIAKKAPLGVVAEFVDPLYLYLQLKIIVTYNAKITNLTAGQIYNGVSTAVQDFFDTELNILNKNFYANNLLNYIKEVSPSVLSVNIIPNLQLRHSVNSFNNAESITLNYGNRLTPGTLSSTWFNSVVSNTVYKTHLIDVPNDNVEAPEYNGNGIVYLQTADRSNVSKIGTINYNTGVVEITNLKVDSYIDNETFIRVNIKSHDYNKDIKTQHRTRVTELLSSAVEAQPSRNTILSLDDSPLNTNVGSRKGLDIVILQNEEST